jgi:hypothetical protein
MVDSGATMTIYILTVGEYSDYHVIGAYSSRDIALEMAEFFGAGVEEYAVDAGVELVRRGAHLYVLRLQRETGDVLECHQDDSDYYYREGDRITVDINKNLFMVCWAMDDAEAIKIAGDRRRAFLANELVEEKA